MFYFLPLCQVQIQEQPVLQMATSAQQDMQGMSTSQLVPQEELTEEQQQQVPYQKKMQWNLEEMKRVIGFKFEIEIPSNII